MFKIHVLTTAITRPTGRALAEALQQVPVEDVSVSVGMELRRDVDLLVRWGTRAAVGYSYDAEFNPADSIRLASDKKAMLQAFNGHGVPTPRWYPSEKFNLITRFPIIVRYRRHFKGKGFYVVHNQYDLRRYADGEHYAVERINVQEEYRIFVFDGKIFEINKKSQEGERLRNLNPLIKNLENGWVCRRGGFDVPEGARTVAKRALAATGLTFGACDVYRDMDGSIGVFEINSAPGLVDRKANKLAHKIIDKYYTPIEWEI